LNLTEPAKLVLATGNADKVREIKAILGDLPVELMSLADFPEVEPAAEDGITFEENAIKKALHVFNATGLPALADDSGLEVDALDGKPGVHSARFAGEGASYADNNRKLLDLLSGVPDDDRAARFVCVAVLVTPKGKLVMQRGEVKGRIIDHPRGEGGFGYDPVFYLRHEKKTMAELDEAQKNRISHRANALEGIRPFIISLCKPAS
jgi:XTP/dITP diphosphohydrolase